MMVSFFMLYPPPPSKPLLVTDQWAAFWRSPVADNSHMLIFQPTEMTSMGTSDSRWGAVSDEASFGPD